MLLLLLLECSAESKDRTKSYKLVFYKVKKRKRLTLESAKSSIFSMKNPFILNLFWKKIEKVPKTFSSKGRSMLARKCLQHGSYLVVSKSFCKHGRLKGSVRMGVQEVGDPTHGNLLLAFFTVYGKNCAVLVKRGYLHINKANLGGKERCPSHIVNPKEILLQPLLLEF